MKAHRPRHWLPVFAILIAVLWGCKLTSPARPHPTMPVPLAFNNGGAGLGVNWAVSAVLFANGTTIRAFKLNYGFTLPETVPHLYRVTDQVRYEARDPPLCESLPCTGQVNPTFYAPGDDLPDDQVVHFNVEVRYTIPDDTTTYIWWSPTQTAPSREN